MLDRAYDQEICTKHINNNSNNDDREQQRKLQCKSSLLWSGHNVQYVMMPPDSCTALLYSGTVWN